MMTVKTLIAGRTYHFVDFVMRRPNSIKSVQVNSGITALQTCNKDLKLMIRSLLRTVLRPLVIFVWYTTSRRYKLFSDTVNITYLVSF